MRSVYCEDALRWLQTNGPIQGASLLTSLPDWSEFPGFTLRDWEQWFTDAAATVLQACPEDGVAVFCQTDIKHEGLWVDKSWLIGQAARAVNVSLLWHKVVCRVPVGSITFGRPAYAHLQCFSRGLRLSPGRSTADVVPGGKPARSRGMGLEVCRLVCRFVREHTRSHTLVAPFCGTGLALAVAEQSGLQAVGIELSRKRARAAERMQAPGEA